jgi:hypothetical protein
MLDQPLSDRLQSKSVKQSIISSIARDFNVTPILAEAYFSQISGRRSGEIPEMPSSRTEPFSVPMHHINRQRPYF